MTWKLVILTSILVFNLRESVHCNITESPGLADMLSPVDKEMLHDHPEHLHVELGQVAQAHLHVLLAIQGGTVVLLQEGLQEKIFKTFIIEVWRKD